MTVETITIITEMIDRASGKLQKVQEVTRQFNHSAKTMTETTRKLNAETNKMDAITRRTTRGLKTFQFEFLSVMFLGMAINRVFSQYVKNALEMTGITELFNETLSLLVFSALEPFLEIFYGLIDAFLNLPKPMQKAIGWFIILVTILSGFAMWFAILKLGLGGLAQALTGPVMSAIWALIGSVGLAGIIAIIAVILVVLVGMYNAWNTNFMGMRTITSNFVNAIKQLFGGMFNILKGMIQLFYALFTGDTQRAKDAILEIWNGLKNSIVGLFNGILNFIAMIGIGIINIFRNAISVIWDLFSSLGNKIGGWVRNIPVIGSVVSKISGRAIGGPVMGGTPYLVGEAGPELFVPSGRGNIVPNNQIGGGIVFSPVYNINVADKSDFERLIKLNNQRQVEDLRRLISD